MFIEEKNLNSIKRIRIFKNRVHRLKRNNLVKILGT
jgi:hypothetical protein